MAEENKKNKEKQPITPKNLEEKKEHTIKNNNEEEKIEKETEKGKTKKVVQKEKGSLIDPKDIESGMTVKIYQKIKEINKKGETKERLQFFEGIVLARKHGAERGATVTVRKISNGVGVEKIFPLNLPTISKVELLKKSQIRRSKLYFLREPRKKKLKEKKA